MFSYPLVLQVRENDVNPMRVIWRGNNGHAFLHFETDDSAHEAAKLLEVSRVVLHNRSAQ